MEARWSAQTTVGRMRAPETIVCVDCGGTCHLLAHPETEFDPGDPVAYRCADCVDRWDLVMPDDEDDGQGDEAPRAV
mgnify:FL=1